MNSQEQVIDGTIVTDEDLSRLKECKTYKGALSHKRSLDCIKRFYEQYTLGSGVRRAFSHLAALEKRDPEFIEDCHYISHGIGHAQLQVNKGDAGKAFAELSENLYFKNVSTCGNGYFHGVIEEFARLETDKDKLVSLLKPTCDSQRNSLSDCFHGIGHAAFIQLNYNTNEALYVCDAVSDDPFMNYSCHMGVFMEMTQDFNREELVEISGDRIIFKTCDLVADRYKEACYSQLVAYYEDIAVEPKNYAKTIQSCKQIENPRYRMACVKFFAGKAVRSVQYTDVKGLCIDGTSTKDERIMCTAAFATRIARSVDSRKGALHDETVSDICKYLPFYEVGACLDLGLRQRDKIYYDPVNTGVM